MKELLLGLGLLLVWRAYAAQQPAAQQLASATTPLRPDATAVPPIGSGDRVIYGDVATKNPPPLLICPTSGGACGLPLGGLQSATYQVPMYQHGGFNFDDEAGESLSQYGVHFLGPRLPLES